MDIRTYRMVSALAMTVTLCLGMGMSVAAKTKLNYIYNWYSNSEMEVGFKNLIADFQKQNPDIEVVATRGGDSNKLVTSIVAGTVPDIVHFDRYIVVEWAARGLLRPIDDMLPTDKTSRNILKSAIGEATFEGKVYALPLDTDVRGLYLNTNMLKTAGLPETGPKTWEDVGLFADRMTKKSDGKKYQSMGFLPWAGNWFSVGWCWTFGGEVYDAKTKLPTINDPKNIKAYLWADSYGKKYGSEGELSKSGFAGYYEFFTAFTKGKLGMMVAHTGTSTILAQGKIGFDATSVRMPHPQDGRNGTWSGGFAHVVPKGARHPKEAARFLKYLSKPEVQARFFQDTGNLPANRVALEKVDDRIAAVNRPLLPDLDEARWRPPFGSIIWDTLEPVMMNVRNQKGDPVTMLNDAQRACLTRWKILVKGR